MFAWAHQGPLAACALALGCAFGTSVRAKPRVLLNCCMLIDPVAVTIVHTVAPSALSSLMEPRVSVYKRANTTGRGFVF
uniref:Putative secreted protein n=1 Tax=Anopheles triannulatus TaxID=58253 RepID=A0A2M4B0N8_9DIPT